MSKIILLMDYNYIHFKYLSFANRFIFINLNIIFLIIMYIQFRNVSNFINPYYFIIVYE